jgi:hypothetical protein
MDIAIAIVAGIAAVAFACRAALALRGGDPTRPRSAGPPTQPLELAWRTAEADRIFDEATDAPEAWAQELHESATRDCQHVPAWLDVAGAHRVVQLHLECSSMSCNARRAALDVLRLAGHYVPAQRSEEQQPGGSALGARSAGKRRTARRSGQPKSLAKQRQAGESR